MEDKLTKKMTVLKEQSLVSEEVEEKERKIKEQEIAKMMVYKGLLCFFNAKI